MLLDVFPGLGGQVHLLADFPVADHGAQLFGRAVDEGLFLFAQLCFRVGEQFVPVRPAAEQLAVPPHRAGFDGLALGFRHGRQHLSEPGEKWGAEQFAAQIRQGQRQRYAEPQQPEDRQ
ncbi:hypothetical protein FQZ97_1178460 [compost metagenome]